MVTQALHGEASLQASLPCTSAVARETLDKVVRWPLCTTAAVRRLLPWQLLRRRVVLSQSLSDLMSYLLIVISVCQHPAS